MIFERTHAGEVRALARLLLVDEQDVLVQARKTQAGLKDIDEIDAHTYETVMNWLTSKIPSQPVADGDEEEEDEEDCDDDLTEDEKYFEGLWADREDTAESLAIERAIREEWW